MPVLQTVGNAYSFLVLIQLFIKSEKGMNDMSMLTLPHSINVGTHLMPSLVRNILDLSFQLQKNT